MTNKNYIPEVFVIIEHFVDGMEFSSHNDSIYGIYATKEIAESHKPKSHTNEFDDSYSYSIKKFKVDKDPYNIKELLKED
jgi:hypothetical protein